LEGAGGAEVFTVAAVSGSQVRLSATPTNPYREGDAVTVIEADLAVRYRPVAGDELTERFAGMRLTQDGHPDSLLRPINARLTLITGAAGPDYDGTSLLAFPAVNTAPRAQLSGGNDALSSLQVADFVGANNGPGARTGIQALEDIDEVAICLVPGMWSE